MEEAKQKANQAAEELFSSTKEKWLTLEGKLTTHDQGYFPLYGPPFVNPSLLIVSDQPGSGAQVTYDQITPAIWPPELSYIQSSGRFATILKQIVSTEILRRSVATTAIFFRAPSLDAWKKAGSREVIADAEAFCRDRVIRLAAAIQPKAILLSGGKAKALFFNDSSFDGRPFHSLDWRDIPTVACKHLSGQHNHDVRSPAVLAEIRDFISKLTS